MRPLLNPGIVFLPSPGEGGWEGDGRGAGGEGSGAPKEPRHVAWGVSPRTGREPNPKAPKGRRQPRFDRPSWPATSSPSLLLKEKGGACDAVPVGPSLSFRRGTEGEVAGHNPYFLL